MAVSLRSGETEALEAVAIRSRLARAKRMEVDQLEIGISAVHPAIFPSAGSRGRPGEVRPRTHLVLLKLSTVNDLLFLLRLSIVRAQPL